MQEEEGYTLTDDMIRERIRTFAPTTTTPEEYTNISASWIEKFRRENNLTSALSRETSLMPDDPAKTSTESSSFYSLGGNGPVFSKSTPSSDLHGVQSRESLEDDSSDTVDFNTYPTYQSESATSLNTTFADTASHSISSGVPSAVMSSATSTRRTAPSASVGRFTPTLVLPATASTNITADIQSSQAITSSDQSGSSSTGGGLPRYKNVQDITREEAQQALEVLMDFVQRQENGFLSFNEMVLLGKLTERVQLTGMVS